jgi:protein SCO1/2
MMKQQPVHMRAGVRALPLLAVLLLGMALLAACGTSQAGAGESESAAPVYEPPADGTPIEPERELVDFTLPNQDGEMMSLSDLRGKPTVIYFGYTYCPDICPTTLADLVRAKRSLGELGDEVNFVMVSVDPDRDTPQVLDRYLENFDEDFIGMSADNQTLRRIGADYGLYVQRRDIEGTSADYLIDHSAATYLVDEEGNLVMMYGYGIPAEVVEEDLRALLEGEEL